MADVTPRDKPAGSRIRRLDVVAAVITAIVAAGLLVGLPPLDLLDPDSAGTIYPTVGGPTWTVLWVGLIVQSVVLVGASRWPRATTVIIAAVPVPMAMITTTTLYGITALPIIVSVVLAALRVRWGRSWPTLTAAALLVLVGQAVMIRASSAGHPVGDAPDALPAVAAAVGQGALQAVGVVGLPLVIALVVQSRREVRRAREAETLAVEREADARIEAAIARERAAMARELHDIAAHHLSGIALIAAVIDRQIDTDPESAHAHARQAREQSTSVLEDLRRLVGLLRDDGAAQRSVETLAGVTDLVDRARLRGPVELRLLSAPDRRLGRRIGPLAQLAGYRTVQESLANAALHAPGAPIVVSVDDRDERVAVITVTNTAVPPGRAATHPSSAPAGSSGGYGLLGMRERADLVRAGLRYGHTDDGGWQVRLVLTREQAPAGADVPDDVRTGS